VQNKLVIAASINISDRNAPAVHLLSLAKHLQLRGHRVVLIVPEYEGTLPVDLPENSVVLETTKRLRLPAIPNSLGVVMQLRALWRHRQCGTLYLRSGTLTLVLALAAKSFGYKRLVLEVNGWLADELKVRGHSRLLTSLVEKMQFAEMSLANSVRVVTSGLKDLLVSGSVNEQKIQVIGNGTDIDTFRPLDRAECRSLFNLRKNTKYLIFAGNLAEWQDLTTVFEAMPIILERGYNVELLILGDGREKNRFYEEVERVGITQSVQFLGAKPLETLNQYLNAADIGLAPFRKARNARIGLSPLKIRDYAAAGLPVITSNLPGLDTFQQESWITLVEPENARAFADAIIRWLDDPDEQRRLTARAYAVQNFSWADVVQQLEAHINAR